MEGAAPGVDKAADAKALCCRGLLAVAVPMAVVVVRVVMALQPSRQDVEDAIQDRFTISRSMM